MTRTRYSRPARGFSMVELAIVVAITLVVAAVAIPQGILATESFKLRSAASSFSGTVQRARMLSVSRNRSFPLVAESTSGPIYVGLPAGDTELNVARLQLPQGIVVDSSGANPSDAALRGSVSTAIYNTLPRFNPRGMPCFTSGCSVNPSQMYITYLRQNRTLGGTGWAAITVTPAGRVQVWTWNGSNWQ